MENLLLAHLHIGTSSGDCKCNQRMVVCGVQGWTPLHSAVSAGHDLVVERLIGVDADVNAVTSGGQTLLHYAASHPVQGLLRLQLDIRCLLQ